MERFDQIMEQYADTITRIGYLYLQNQQDVEDWKRKLFFRKHEDLDALVLAAPESQEWEMLQLIRSLPAKYALPLYLHYFEGYEVSEIAEVLQKKENTIKTWMRRGRQMLKGEWER